MAEDLPMQEGALIRIVAGVHIGQRAEIVAILPNFVRAHIKRLAPRDAKTAVLEVELQPGEYRRAPRRGEAKPV